MKNNSKVTYRNWYRVTDHGSYVEVMFCVEDSKGTTLVAQKEGMFDNMQAASYLVNYLEKIGAEMEYIVTGSQTK
jgi:hypothetical protein